MQSQTDITLDPTFSVFRSLREEGVLRAIRHRPTMQLISSTIENATIQDKARTRIFAGFQRMGKFLRRLARYNTLSFAAEMVYVFGVPDVTLPKIPNVTYVPLKPTDQLAKEWFLVSYGPDYWSALATEELTHIDDPDHLRMFDGYWTFDQPLIAKLHDQLSTVVAAPPLSFDPAKRNADRQLILMGRTMERLTARVERMGEKTDALLKAEANTAVKLGAQPPADAPVAAPQQEQEAVILFSDIRDFANLTESMRPAEIATKVLTPYFDSVSEIIMRHGGRIDKFLGDGVLAVFGLDASPNSADAALAAAAEILKATAKNQLVAGIGLDAGPVLISQIGSAQYKESTIIGATVNHAHRISQQARNEVWLSQAVYGKLSANEGIKPKGEMMFKGLTQPITIYTL